MASHAAFDPLLTLMDATQWWKPSDEKWVSTIRYLYDKLW